MIWLWFLDALTLDFGCSDSATGEVKEFWGGSEGLRWVCCGSLEGWRKREDKDSDVEREILSVCSKFVCVWERERGSKLPCYKPLDVFKIRHRKSLDWIQSHDPCIDKGTKVPSGRWSMTRSRARGRTWSKTSSITQSRKIFVLILPKTVVNVLRHSSWFFFLEYIGREREMGLWMRERDWFMSEGDRAMALGFIES